MRIIISPAKKMNVDADSLPVRALPAFLEQTEELCRELQGKSPYLRHGIRFITCVFGEKKDGKIIEKGTMCKMARGEMVRYMAERQITNPEDIRASNRLDYAFDSERSDEETYVFVKRGEGRSV